MDNYTINVYHKKGKIKEIVLTNVVNLASLRSEVESSANVIQIFTPLPPSTPTPKVNADSQL